MTGGAYRTTLAVILMGFGCAKQTGGYEPPPVVLVEGPSSNPLPEPTPPPSCIRELVDTHHVCGLGVAGRAFRWNDKRMRDLARGRAARNLAGMLRAVVTSALIVEQDEDKLWTRQEQYLEIDESLIERIEKNAEFEIWFDVTGEGPFREAERTYACACMTTAEAGIEIDSDQAANYAFGRQYSVDEVPDWLTNIRVQNRALRCAIGYQDRMYHPEEMLKPLSDSVRAQLMRTTRSWVLSELDEHSLCRGRGTAECRTEVESVVEAANEGVSRGVALTSIWFDPVGLGPVKKKSSAYGWGCVFDASVLTAARDRLEQIRGGKMLASHWPTGAFASTATVAGGFISLDETDSQGLVQASSTATAAFARVIAPFKLPVVETSSSSVD